LGLKASQTKFNKFEQLDAQASANAITILSPNFWTIIDGEYEILLTHNDIIVNNYGIINDGQFIQTGQKKLEFLMKLINLKIDY
jgi:hypothetical protein